MSTGVRQVVAIISPEESVDTDSDWHDHDMRPRMSRAIHASAQHRRASRRSLSLASMLVVGILVLTHGSPARGQSVPTPATRPVPVDVTLNINKIYNIDSVNQTYEIDGYLVLVWTDERLAFVPDADGQRQRTYENDAALDEMGPAIWWPSIEFINVVGERDVPSRRLVVNSDGRIVYNERFYGTFTSEMDFRRFPFDTQDFVVQIESFSYDASEVEFVAGDAAIASSGTPAVDAASAAWLFDPPTASIRAVLYPHLEEATGSETYSRYEYVATADRNPGFFIWQLFLPLFLIIGTSFFVLWISDFTDQLATAFTLMLTVVAFNFYVSGLLPQLPYTTFIEATITSGYITIVGIIALTVIAHVAATRDREELAEKVIRASRWIVAPAYGLSLVVSWRYFLA